jgi:hypothetical protein
MLKKAKKFKKSPPPIGLNSEVIGEVEKMYILWTYPRKLSITKFCSKKDSANR